MLNEITMVIIKWQHRCQPLCYSMFYVRSFPGWSLVSCPDGHLHCAYQTPQEVCSHKMQLKVYLIFSTVMNWGFITWQGNKKENYFLAPECNEKHITA